MTYGKFDISASWSIVHFLQSKHLLNQPHGSTRLWNQWISRLLHRVITYKHFHQFMTQIPWCWASVAFGVRGMQVHSHYTMKLERLPKVFKTERRHRVSWLLATFFKFQALNQFPAWVSSCRRAFLARARLYLFFSYISASKSVRILSILLYLESINTMRFVSANRIFRRWLRK